MNTGRQRLLICALLRDNSPALHNRGPLRRIVVKPGYYPKLSNQDYHTGPGVSKSTLDLVHKAPALVQWSRAAPRDDNVGAVDIGDAFHAYLLEPERFAAEYVAAPSVDRRTKVGKEAWQDFLDEADGKTVLTDEDARKLALMRDSAMAHPVARKLVESAGDVEASIYWIDAETGMLCRCRPDKLVNDIRVVLDVKTCADIDRFGTSVNDYRYHVQDAFYTEGYTRHFGEAPGAFMFLVVSTMRDACRYPVRLFALPPSERDAGGVEYRNDLRTIAECERTGIWPGIETISRPAWAVARSAH